jgi:hypothetical protein
MAQVRKRIAPPLVGSDIILVIRPGQNINQVLDCTYQELVNSLSTALASASGLVPETRTLTINGVTYDLTQDRSWTVSGGGAVDSVNGQTGVVILALDDLSDVNAPSPTNGQILQWNGTQWVSATVGAAAWGSIGAGTGVGSQADLVAYLAANYQVIGSYVLTTRTITINGLTQDLSANRTWNLTANNGVQQESGNPTNFELGGSIIKSTFIDVGPSNSGHDLQFDSNGPLGGSGKVKFTATTGTYSPTDKLVRFEASGAISAYVIAAGTNGTGILIQSTSSGAVPMIISNSSSAEILRMLNSGQLQLNLYNSATAFQGSSGSSVGVLNVDNTGKLFVGAGGGGGGVTSVGATAPITSSGGTTPNISTSMNTNKLIGRGTAGVGVMEEITLGTNLSLSGTTLNATGGGGLKSGTATGTNTYAVTITGVTSYTDGDTYVIKFTNGNDADSDININGLGVKNLVKQFDVRVTGGDIVSGQELIIIYDGTNFQTLGVAPNQLFAYVTNDDSVTINKGQPVYAFGAAGNRMSVKLASNLQDSTSAQTVGVVFSSSIAAGQKGFIITQGVISGLNTAAYSPGAQLYLGATAGTLTSTKPYAPNHLVYIGIVERANAGNGQIYIKPQNGYELNELHDVDLITSLPTNNQVLSYQTGTPNLWKNKNVIDIAPASLKTGSCGVTFDGQGGTISNGKTAYVQIPYNGTLTGWTLVSNASGSCTVTVFKDTYANFPPLTPSDNIYTVQPALSSQQRNQNLTPTYVGSQSTVTAGDYIGFTISGVLTVSWVNLTLTINKT